MTMVMVIADALHHLTDIITEADAVQICITDTLMTADVNRLRTIIIMIADANRKHIITMTAVAKHMSITKISADVMIGLSQETADKLCDCSHYEGSFLLL
jgi:hypothetical protein